MMKSLTLLALIFLSQISWARPLTWDELEFDQKYHLISPIQITDKLKLTEYDGLMLFDRGSGPGFIYFVFKNLSCQDDKVESELILFNPDPSDSTEKNAVGVKLDLNCEVGLYIETRQYYQLSVFN